MFNRWRSDGVVSWGLSWRNDHCIELETIRRDCGRLGNEPMPTAVDGPQVHPVGRWCLRPKPVATAALVLTHRPQTLVTSPDLSDGDLQCNDIDMETNFTGTTSRGSPSEVDQQVQCISTGKGFPDFSDPVEADPGGSTLLLIQDGRDADALDLVRAAEDLAHAGLFEHGAQRRSDQRRDRDTRNLENCFSSGIGRCSSTITSWNRRASWRVWRFSPEESPRASRRRRSGRRPCSRVRSHPGRACRLCRSCRRP